MAGTDLQEKTLGSLAEQIAETERRLLNRQQLIGLRRSLLNQHVRQKNHFSRRTSGRGGGGLYHR